jgi:16S rRNA (guanine527-N7)-methyltransferase
VKRYDDDRGGFHVKHLPPALRPEFHRLLAELEISVDPAGAELLLDHLAWLLHTTALINLTAITDPRTALRLHLIDSLTALPEVVGAPDGPLLDIGTGGGYPGFPLAVASGRDAVLLDSVGKKAHALAAFLVDRGITSVTTVPSRAEEYAVEAVGDFSVVVARAVGSLASLVELAAPLLKQPGVFVALKGRLDEAELERGNKAGQQVGLTLTAARTLELPGGRESRTVLTYTRTHRPSLTLPRRTGLAQKSPLA